MYDKNGKEIPVSSRTTDYEIHDSFDDQQTGSFIKDGKKIYYQQVGTEFKYYDQYGNRVNKDGKQITPNNAENNKIKNVKKDNSWSIIPGVTAVSVAPENKSNQNAPVYYYVNGKATSLEEINLLDKNSIKKIHVEKDKNNNDVYYITLK